MRRIQLTPVHMKQHLGKKINIGQDSSTHILHSIEWWIPVSYDTWVIEVSTGNDIFSWEVGGDILENVWSPYNITDTSSEKKRIYSQISKKINIPLQKSVMNLNDVKITIKFCKNKLKCGSVISDLSCLFEFKYTVRNISIINPFIEWMCKLTKIIILSIDKNVN